MSKKADVKMVSGDTQAFYSFFLFTISKYYRIVQKEEEF